MGTASIVSLMRAAKARNFMLVRMSEDRGALLTRYMHDAEFHAAVHRYAGRTRGNTEWPDEAALLADCRDVVDREAKGLGWSTDE